MKTSLFKLLGEIVGFCKKCPVVSEDSCTICLNPISVGGRIDCCEHIFCLDCIKRWSKESNRCPNCRKVFKYITPCRVFASEEELQKSYAYSNAFCSENCKMSSPRIAISEVNYNPSKLNNSCHSDNGMKQSGDMYTRSSLTRRYSSR